MNFSLFNDLNTISHLSVYQIIKCTRKNTQSIKTCTQFTEMSSMFRVNGQWSLVTVINWASQNYTWITSTEMCTDKQPALLNKQPMGCKAQPAWKCLVMSYSWAELWPVRKVRLIWFLVCDQSSFVGLHRKDYKFSVQRLRFVPPWSTIQHRDTETAFDQCIHTARWAEL